MQQIRSCRTAGVHLFTAEAPARRDYAESKSSHYPKVVRLCFSTSSKYNPSVLRKLNYNLPDLSRLDSMIEPCGKGVYSWLFV